MISILFLFQFVASPKCQYVLNEIVYHGWRNWQDRGIVRKGFLFLIQFLLVAVTCIFYIPVRLVRRCRNDCEVTRLEGIDDSEVERLKDKKEREFQHYWWTFRKFYELPYSKFINQTMSYVLFLCLLFASSFHQKSGRTKIGLGWIGKVSSEEVATAGGCQFSRCLAY